ncbi:12947_t:CDS:10 [Cetraspora pellucida]|uniref:12947_t:CDS:1 n=1 Tax=Cetraspora pellucida TaxID=1433469 RepID=A0ACA9KVQ7_9GLOM|nr:12947_t:CDS:10 [Cetraspora pellucida]
MLDEPIKLQDNLHLYSGDVITINNSNPLLVVADDADKQTIKLRNIKDNKYLKENNKFSQNTENVANYKEIIEDIKLHKEKEEKSNEEELLITSKFYDNKSGNYSKHTFIFAETRQKEHSVTQSKEFTFGASANLKLTFSSLAGLDIGGKFEKKIGDSNTVKTVDSETIQESSEVSEKEVLIRIGEAINSAYQGLSHVLFVFAGRFSDQEKEGFQKLSAFKIINSFITVVRSRFDNFGNKKACEKDRESLEKEGGSEISQVFNNCRGLLHVDNDKKDEDSYYLKEKEKLENEKNQANIDQKEEIEQRENKLNANIAENVREEMKGKEMREFATVIESDSKINNSLEERIDNIGSAELEEISISEAQKSTPNEASEKKTILLIGRTGRGKSTLANVLTNRREIEREKVTKEFEEKNNKCHKCEQEFVRGVNKEKKDNKWIKALIEEKGPYLFHEEVIDTPGIGDNRKDLPPEKILDIIAEAIFLVKEGVSHVFFITDGRFEKYEMATYNVLRRLLFDKAIVQYTTIIRTKFDDFNKKEVCQKDLKEIREENAELREIIDSCRGMLHLISDKNCKIEDNENKFEKTLVEESRIETKLAVSEKKEQVDINQNIEFEENNVINDRFEEIIILGDKRDELKKEIEEKEKNIRQKVLKHIFNNYEGITSELGGTKVLGNNFKTACVHFCAWLQNDKKLTVQEVEKLSRGDFEELMEAYADQSKEVIDIYISQKENQDAISDSQVLEKSNVRSINVLLIGRSGSGKSTLANVISGTNKFKEGEFGVSETREINDEIFEMNRIKYRVIDTPGLGDTKMSKIETLQEISKVYDKIKHGLSQVLFVNSGRFTPEEIEIYNMLKEILFDENIAKYTTIVRTNFNNFEDGEKCEEDVKLLLEEDNKAITEMIKSCDKRIIHVDNPPINISGSGSKRVKRQIDLNKEIREISRERLIDHLAKCDKIYKPESIDVLNKIQSKERYEDFDNKKWDSGNKAINEFILNYQLQATSEIFKTIKNWQNEIKGKKDTEFYRQYLDAEEHNKIYHEDLAVPTFYETKIYHNRLLNIHPDFTPELQKEDVKRKDSEAPSIENDEKELSQEFVQYYQQQYEARQEVNYFPANTILVNNSSLPQNPIPPNHPHTVNWHTSTSPFNSDSLIQQSSS